MEGTGLHLDDDHHPDTLYVLRRSDIPETTAEVPGADHWAGGPYVDPEAAELVRHGWHFAGGGDLHAEAS